MIELYTDLLITGNIDEFNHCFDFLPHFGSIPVRCSCEQLAQMRSS